MKKILIMLLTIFSVSCARMPVTGPKERCVISVKFKKCRCHLYNPMTAERITNSKDYDLEYCEPLVGFRPQQWAELEVWLIENRLFRDDWEK